MEFSGKKCVPCEGGLEPLSASEVTEYLIKIPGWEASENFDLIKKDYKFKNFADALEFTNKVGKIAEDEGHHPDIELGWGYCNIELQTHAISGLHENDFIVATKIDEIN